MARSAPTESASTTSYLSIRAPFSRFRLGPGEDQQPALRRLCLSMELGWASRRSLRHFPLELSEPPVVYRYIFIISLDSCKENRVIWRYSEVILKSNILFPHRTLRSSTANHLVKSALKSREGHMVRILNVVPQSESL